jgi:hypothetical protein
MSEPALSKFVTNMLPVIEAINSLLGAYVPKSWLDALRCTLAGYRQTIGRYKFLGGALVLDASNNYFEVELNADVRRIALRNFVPGAPWPLTIKLTQGRAGGHIINNNAGPVWLDDAAPNLTLTPGAITFLTGFVGEDGVPLLGRALGTMHVAITSIGPGLSIEAVHTVDSTEPAAASISGPGPNYRLTLDIPRGPQGLRGLPGSAGAGAILIAAETVASPTATISFAGDYSAYKNLRIEFTGKVTNSGTATYFPIYLRFNGDAVAAHYDSTVLQYSVQGTVGSSAYAPTTSGCVAFTAATSFSSPYPVSAYSLKIPNNNGPLYRSGWVDGMTRQDTIGIYAVKSAFLWHSAALVSSLDLISLGTTFAVGTTAYLFGEGA